MPERRSVVTKPLLALVVLLLVAGGAAAAADKPYVMVTFQPGSGYFAGIKYPDSNELVGSWIVEPTGEVPGENGGKLYVYEGDGNKFYSPVPPNDVTKPGNPLEAFTTGLQVLLTMGKPVVRVEDERGNALDYREFIRTHGRPGADPGTEAGTADAGKYPVLTYFAVAYTYEKGDLTSLKQVLSFNVDWFDRSGTLTDAKFREIRSRLKVVEVVNNAWIPAFMRFKGAESADRSEIFYLHKFRGKTVFSSWEPEALLATIYAVPLDCLTPEQASYVSKGRFGRWTAGVKDGATDLWNKATRKVKLLGQ